MLIGAAQAEREALVPAKFKRAGTAPGESDAPVHPLSPLSALRPVVGSTGEASSVPQGGGGEDEGVRGS